MTQAAQATALAPAPTATTKNERSRVTGRVKQALDLMVYEGKPFDEAAKAVGLTTQSMRRALARPFVITYLRQQKQVFRTSVSSANISALRKLRDESGNAMAQLGAIKVLEQLDEDQAPGAQTKQQPGMVIVVVGQQVASVTQASAASAPMIDANVVSTEDEA